MKIRYGLNAHCKLKHGLIHVQRSKLQERQPPPSNPISSAEQALKLAESPRSRHKLNKERTSAQSVEARIDGGACLSIDIWAKGSESISELIKL